MFDEDDEGVARTEETPRAKEVAIVEPFIFATSRNEWRDAEQMESQTRNKTKDGGIEARERKNDGGTRVEEGQEEKKKGKE